MSPKKKARFQVAAQTATSMSDVTKLQLSLRDWIQEAHNLRHASGHDGDGRSPHLNGWASVEPGTFRSFAKQVWSNPGRLMKGSVDLLQKAGIMEVGSTVEDLGLLAMKLEARVLLQLHLDCFSVGSPRCGLQSRVLSSAALS